MMSAANGYQITMRRCFSHRRMMLMEGMATEEYSFAVREAKLLATSMCKVHCGS